MTRRVYRDLKLHHPWNLIFTLLLLQIIRNCNSRGEFLNKFQKISSTCERFQRVHVSRVLRAMHDARFVPLSQHVIYEIFTLYPFTIYICIVFQASAQSTLNKVYLRYLLKEADTMEQNSSKNRKNWEWEKLKKTCLTKFCTKKEFLN